MNSCTNKKYNFPHKNWLSLLNVDEKQRKKISRPTYSNLYAYAGNNPVRYLDPDGREAYLLTWATNSRQFGHSAFAVDNYDENGNCDGTVTFYELGPKDTVPAGREMENVDAYYGKKCINKDELFSENLSHFDSNKADGIIKFSTLPKTDAKTKTALDNFMTSSNVYNAESRNCSDMARIGVKKSKNGFKFGLGKEHYLWHSFTTPNKLFTDSKKMKNATVILDPGEKTNFSFKDYYVVPRVEAYKNRNTIDESLDYLFQ